MALPLSPQVFAILSGLVAERTGLQYDLSHLSVFAERASARAAEVGFDSLLDYYYFLRYDEGGTRELAALTETLVVGETYFFRELDPLRAVVDEFILPALTVRRPRVWSAACATGEEPHTLAMLLASRGLLDQVDLVASDISAASLARARSGTSSRRSIRQALPQFAERFVEMTDREVRVSPRLTEAIDWRHLNLTDEAAVAAMGTFDVVLCRNVLIYFGDDTIRRVVARLGEGLRPGGALFVGVSESLLRFGTSLTCEELGGVFFYRKPA
jgi:chemotaxis protein methyltransferase CheR